ncbi:MAG: HdeD family acid-resistance protein [Pseudonocardiaceae bacterium]
MTESSSTDRVAEQAGAQLARVGRSRGWTEVFGALTLVAGILVLVWPGRSVLVVAVVVGIWLLVAGVFRLVAAIAVDDTQGSSRVLLALLGLVAILAGLLCLARPFHSAAALVLVLGVFWVVGGIIEFFHGLVTDAPGRGWAVAGGLVSVIAGIVVLTFPAAGLVALTWLFGIVLIVLGAVAITGGFAGPSSATTSAHRTTGTPGPVTP